MSGYNFFLSALLAIVLSGCSMIESSPYDVHITGRRNLTSQNIALIEQKMSGHRTMRFAMISDSQRYYDDTEDAVLAINARGDVDFVVHGGDLTEYAATKEFLWQRDILCGLSMPWVCVIGNHDCIANGVETYQTVFGDLNFAFTAGNVRFLCLNSNSLEFDHSVAVPDLGFIKNEIANVTPEVEKTVVLMHAGPESSIFDSNVREEFHALIKQMPGLQFCLYGHGHNLSIDDYFSDGILYYECATTHKRSYLLFTLHEDNTYTYEVVNF